LGVLCEKQKADAMRVVIRRSRIYKFEAARLGVRLYVYPNHSTLQFDFIRNVFEVIFYIEGKQINKGKK
jgi:hypothetical protein